jgi:hypothetical protein
MSERPVSETPMINIATVHWRTAKWVDAQLHYLGRSLAVPYRVFASLNEIDDPALGERFHYAADLQGGHAAKLNELADIIARSSAPSDILIFLDGDAFPIRPLVPWVVDTVRKFALTAVRRDENLGDCQPHPSFCATTVGFWQDIDGDWRAGGTWINEAGREVADIGGNLLYNLRDRGVDWLPLLRTNTYNPHPVWFGVYDHRVYHHGGGFQATKVERVDWAGRYQQNPAAGRSLRPSAASPSIGTLRTLVAADPRALRRLRPRHLGQLSRAAVKTIRLRLEHRHYLKLTSTEQAQLLDQLNDEVFDRLSVDDDFYREFDDSVPLAVPGAPASGSPP